jgi:hypothetical protein
MERIPIMETKDFARGFGWFFGGLAFLKLARLGGIAPVSEFTRHEKNRLKALAEGPCTKYRNGVELTIIPLVRFIPREKSACAGPAIEILAHGWHKYNAIRDRLSLED